MEDDTSTTPQHRIKALQPHETMNSIPTRPSDQTLETSHPVATAPRFSDKPAALGEYPEHLVPALLNSALQQFRLNRLVFCTGQPTRNQTHPCHQSLNERLSLPPTAFSTSLQVGPHRLLLLRKMELVAQRNSPRTHKSSHCLTTGGCGRF